MKEKLTKEFISQIDKLIELYKSLRSKAKYDDLSDLHDDIKTSQVVTMFLSAIERISGKNSVYYRQATSSLRIPTLVGILDALKADLESGYLLSVEELIHGEVFGDLLESAEHLLEEGYKDPAAVFVGCVLEEHLRQLCKKNDIETETNTKSGIKPKKADLMNSELSKARVYSVLDQKNITAWLDLRNNAAHGKFDEYAKEQVSIMMSGVRDFVSRVPA